MMKNAHTLLEHARSRRDRSRSGQVIIFFIMILVILTFMVLWNFDLHKLLYVKGVTQNGGDAASLMAARWQAISLNVVGDLNLMQAIALSAGDMDTVDAITNIQPRLLFVGPMVAFQASQQAAKNNGIFENESYTDFIRDHADTVRNEYTTPSSGSGTMLFPEPYPGAWTEYADMLDLVADDGVAAGPDNMRLFADVGIGGHTLYDESFYDAIAGQTWCWFYNSAPTLLSDYSNFFPAWWSALPTPPMAEPINSEFYALHLTKAQTTLQAIGITSDQLAEHALDRNFTGTISTEGTQIATTWYVYTDRWGDWDAMSTEGEYPFPLAGPVRDVYNYSGADAAVRVEATTSRLMPGNGGAEASDTITWTSAAKPLGYLNETDRPMDYGLVLPAFHDVRLIPVDGSSAPAAGAFDLRWRQHVGTHLPLYMGSGPFALSSTCYYCRQLQTWEGAGFRQTGANWLQINSEQCIAKESEHGGSGGGGGGGGGARRRRGH
jgi:hypothetical protein